MRHSDSVPLVSYIVPIDRPLPQPGDALKAISGWIAVSSRLKLTVKVNADSPSGSGVHPFF